MKDYNIVEYWNQRENPCSKSIGDLTSIHKNYLQSQVFGCNKIMDFGPGYGRMFSAYSGVSEVVGVDVTEQHKEDLYKEAEKHKFKFELLCKKDNFDKLNFPDKYFDAVVTSEVLFHQTPNTVVNIMKELIRISQKVIVISYMNLKESYDKLNNNFEKNRYCFNYDYYKICKKNKWNIRNEERIKNQLMFVYSDVFRFKYDDQEIKFLFDRDSYYMSRIIKKNNSFYEIKYLEYLRDKILNKESCVVEIGAYLGNHTIYFSKIIACKNILCFEPTLYSFSVLRDNLIINNIFDVKCFQVAIASKIGKMKVFKSNPDNPGANQYQYDKTGIECSTLDSIVSTKVDFIKIDVENSEMDVLVGCENTIKNFRPIIMIEVGKENISDMKTWMNENKYKRISLKIFNKNTWLLKG